VLDIVANRRQRGWRGLPVHPNVPLRPTMMYVFIDLNADVGEGLEAADAAILPLISSANIACGGHAGDERSMARTVELALRHDVAIGAHPAYPDREGFGRREIDMPLADLRRSLYDQVLALAELARSMGGRMRHVKPHGALYNLAAANRGLADLVADVVRSVDAEAVLVGLAGSELIEAGRAIGLGVANEGFTDRAYEGDGSLRPRSLPGAVIEGAASVAAQALSIARDGRAPLDGGGWVAVDADTLCLHGDSPGAVANAEAICTMFNEAGVVVRAPVADLRNRQLTR